MALSHYRRPSYRRPSYRRPRLTLLRLTLGLVLAAEVALAGAGCRGNPGTPDDRVKVACGAAVELCEGWVGSFNKANPGIKATYVRLSGGETLARLRAKKNDPEFDVWHGGPADSYVAADGENLLDAYVSPNAAKIPGRYKQKDGRWTGVYVGALGFCSNPTALGSRNVAAPQSWQDLLSPSLSKFVGVADPVSSGTAYTGLWTHVARYGGNQDEAIAYAKKLHPNILSYERSGTGPIQRVARGEEGVAVVFSHDCVAAKEQGFSNLIVTYPSEGTGYETGAVALIKKARRPKSGKAFIDWTLTPAAQEIGPTVRAYQRPTNPDAKVSDKAFEPASVKLVDYDVDAAGRDKVELQDRFAREVQGKP